MSMETNYSVTTERLEAGVIVAPDDRGRCYLHRCISEGVVKVRLRLGDQVYTSKDIGYLVRHLTKVMSLLQEENK